MSEPYGTTALPLPAPGWVPHITYHPNHQQQAAQPQQQTLQQVLTTFPPGTGTGNAQDNADCFNGNCVIAVNPHFVCYSVLKKGLIRILHRHSTHRSLLRAHKEQTVSDIQFFQDGDVLATAGYRDTNSNLSAGTTPAEQEQQTAVALSTVVVWRIFERSNEIVTEMLLEIPSHQMQMTRVLWHPFNPNQFWLFYKPLADGKQEATLVETTRITTTPHATHGHAVATTTTTSGDGVTPPPPPGMTATASSGALHDGAIVLQYNKASLQDLQWNGRDTRYVVAGYDNGDLVLWDCKPVNGSGTTTTTQPVQIVNSVEAIDRILFLPHEQTSVLSQSQSPGVRTNCFVTGSNQNRTLTLWSPFLDDPNAPPPQPLQVLEVDSASNSSFVLEMCCGPPTPPSTSPPPSCFVVACDTQSHLVLAWHVSAAWSSTTTAQATAKPLLQGCDYVVPLCMSSATSNATLSFTCLCVPASDISEEQLLQGSSNAFFDMKLFAMQTKSVVCNTITSYMCLPPAQSYTDPTVGVSVKVVPAASATHQPQQDDDDDDIGDDGQKNRSATVSDMEDSNAYEDYDVEEEDDDEEEIMDEAPDPSSLPNPNDTAAAAAAPPAVSASLASNPFANWLGAIAAKTTTTPAPPPPPPPPAKARSQSTPASGPAPQTQFTPPPDVTPPPPPPNPSSSFLSPSDLLSPPPQPSKNSTIIREGTPIISNTTSSSASATTTPAASNTATTIPSSSSNEKKKKKATGNNNNKTPPRNPAPVTILQKPKANHSLSNNNTGSGNNNSILLEEMRQMIRDEIQTTVLPALLERQQQQQQQPSVASTDTANTSTAAALKALQSSVDAIGNRQQQQKQETIQYEPMVSKAVTESVQEPLRAAFTESLKTVLIPTMESVTNQVLQRVSEHLVQQQQNTAAVNNANNQEAQRRHAEDSRRLEAITQQLSQLSTIVTELGKEVQTLSSAEGRNSTLLQLQQPQQQVPMASKRNPEDEQRRSIQQLLQESKYEEAFATAVSSQMVGITLFCCRHADLQEVLGGTQPGLSQPVLLCLMQQLGTALVKTKHDQRNPDDEAQDLKLVLEWLQEIALSLNPSADINLQRHVPGVLQQVVTLITQRMNQTTDDPVLRRQLQRMLQVVRGMQVG